MHLEQESPPRPEPLFLDQRQRSVLRDEVLKTAFRFPRLFNRPLYKSFEQMVVNSSSDFLSNRTNSHLRMILCVQYFLQRRIEAVLQSETEQKHLFLKLFRIPSRICISLVFSSSYTFQKEQLLKALDVLLPGTNEIPRSFYLWHSSELPYYFCYFEIDKMRGKELSTGQLRSIEKTLKEQMLASSPLTPAVFWPFNKEESHRQIQILLREMKSKQDLPHVSIHFQEQTASSLEFLIHLVRPKAAEPIVLDKLHDSLYYFRYSKHLMSTPFPIEIEAFSIKMQPQLFDVRDTINLLYARRYLSKHLESIIGPFRDYNGGLFEKQQDHFEMVRLQLSDKIPSFDLFAEKVFYALHPFERWLALTIEEVEDLFRVFSELIQSQKVCVAKCTQSGLFTVVKMENKVDFLRSAHKHTNLTPYAQLTIGGFHYECFSGEVTRQIHEFLQSPTKEKNTLRLVFQEGSPPSLNPHYSSGDMRCRLLNKLLFEGLTRLDERGEPELAGASWIQVSPDGLSYTFRLRKAHWSNGEKVTTYDYVGSWKWALQEPVSHPELLFSIKNSRKFREKRCSLDQVALVALDAETIQIELEEPDSRFLHKLSQPFFFPLFGNDREPKWFNGPYILHEFKKNGIKLGRNPYFWNGKPNSFEQIAVQWLDDSDAIYDLFKEGKIDWIGDPLTILSHEQIKDLEKDHTLQYKKVLRRFSLHFNTKNPILASLPIRNAFTLSIDRTHICQEIFPHSVPKDPSLYSKEMAIAHFEQGLRELGLTRESFPLLTFSFSDHIRHAQLADYLQRTWAKVLGIQVLLEQQNWNNFRSQFEKKNFEIIGIVQDAFEPSSVPLFDYTHLYAIHPRLECSHFDAEGCVDFSQGTKA